MERLGTDLHDSYDGNIAVIPPALISLPFLETSVREFSSVYRRRMAVQTHNAALRYRFGLGPDTAF
jgi:hypothetical protein